MSEKPSNPIFVRILIVIIAITFLGVIAFVLLATYPADRRVAAELRSRGFDVSYNWIRGSLWKRSWAVIGSTQNITAEDCRLICQLPRLCSLDFVGCDMSGLNWDEINNCQDLRSLGLIDSTNFSVAELEKLAVCPINILFMESRTTKVNDSDLESFVKFKNLDSSCLCITFPPKISRLSLHFM